MPWVPCVFSRTLHWVPREFFVRFLARYAVSFLYVFSYVTVSSLCVFSYVTLWVPVRFLVCYTVSPLRFLVRYNEFPVSSLCVFSRVMPWVSCVFSRMSLWVPCAFSRMLHPWVPREFKFPVRFLWRMLHCEFSRMFSCVFLYVTPSSLCVSRTLCPRALYHEFPGCFLVRYAVSSLCVFRMLHWELPVLFLVHYTGSSPCVFSYATPCSRCVFWNVIPWVRCARAFPCLLVCSLSLYHWHWLRSPLKYYRFHRLSLLGLARGYYLNQSSPDVSTQKTLTRKIRVK